MTKSWLVTHLETGAQDGFFIPTRIPLYFMAEPASAILILQPN